MPLFPPIQHLGVICTLIWSTSGNWSTYCLQLCTRLLYFQVSSDPDHWHKEWTADTFSRSDQGRLFYTTESEIHQIGQIMRTWEQLQKDKSSSENLGEFGQELMRLLIAKNLTAIQALKNPFLSWFGRAIHAYSYLYQQSYGNVEMPDLFESLSKLNLSKLEKFESLYRPWQPQYEAEIFFCDCCTCFLQLCLGGWSSKKAVSPVLAPPDKECNALGRLWLKLPGNRELGALW